MALPTRTLDAYVRRVTGFFRTSWEGRPLGTKRFLGRAARALALAIWSAQKAFEDLSRDIVPSAQMSRDMLSEWAALLGLPDGQGGRGRRLATTASGGVATLTGVKATLYDDTPDLTATAEDGSTQIKLSGSVTIPGSGSGYGSVSAQFVAVTEGEDGNLPAGTVCTWDNPPPGAEASFALTSPLSGGADIESDPAVYARIVARLQTPPRGGVAEDFREWIGDVDGVVGIYIYPKRSGTGTVDVVPLVGGSGQGRVPSATLLDEVQEALDEHTPLGAEQATAVLPYAPDGEGLTVVIRVTPALSRFAFDWDDRADTYLVDTYTPGGPATLKLDGLAPASLKAAITAYIDGVGNAPQLQILSTGSVINVAVAAVAWADVDGNTKTELTLDSLPADFVPPTAGDRVYAYGPVVATIAAGALALCDALGPSRASGFADALSPWPDTLTVSGLTAVAENAIDADGTELVASVAVGGVTIDGVAADVQAADGINGPELLYLEHVAVVRAA